MPYSSRRSDRGGINIWPGFVDALSQLLMVIVFVLLFFTAGQFYLTDALSGRDAALKKLTDQINQLTDVLALERSSNQKLTLNVTQLTAELKSATAERDALTTQVKELAAKADEATAKLTQAQAALAEAESKAAASKDQVELQLRQIASLQHDIDALNAVRADLESKVTSMAAQLDQNNKDLTAARDRSKELEAQLSTAQERTALAQKEIDARDVRLTQAETSVGDLSAQIANLKDELAKLATALDVSEAANKQQQVQLADLGRRLNQALASKVEELARYRSEFFGKLREVLGDRPDIRVVGDRFVFQSEVLFPSSSAELSPAGLQTIGSLASTLKQIEPKIPKDINWILEVDGFTDKRPISTARFPSNWELSSARAIAVVKALVADGIPADHLSAAGFGEYQPIDPADTPAAYAKNRRIELKLTQH